MQFHNRVPEEVLVNPNAEKLIKVLDGLQAYKENQVHKANRFYRPVLETNLTNLRKKIEDYGYPPVPTDFPKEILDTMLLNAQNVMALKGSQQGLEYWLWVMTVGAVTVDDSNFYPDSNYIRLNDLYYGYVSNFSPLATPDLYLFSENANFGTQTLIVDIVTKYDTLDSLKDYIEEHIKKFISFVSDSATITINFTNGPYVTYAEAYQQFVI